MDIKLYSQHCGEEDCQRRWRNLRDDYVRYKKSLNSSLGSSVSRKRKNPVFESMSFLDQFFKHRRPTSNLEFTAPEFSCEVDEAALSDNGSTSSQQDTELQLAPHPQLKRRRMSEDRISDRHLLEAILTTSARSEDEFESFGRSVAATLRHLAPRLQAAAKVKIQQLLFDLEFGETDTKNTVSLDLHCS